MSSTKPNKPAADTATIHADEIDPSLREELFESSNLRTKEGREKFDAAIVSHLSKSGQRLSMGDLRETFGGSTAQIRGSLHRSIEAGLLASSGQKRATRYFVRGVAA